MNGLSAGDTLVGRYQLDTPETSDLADVTAWSAHDRVLDRHVRISILTGEYVSQGLDSARRAALVTEPRLARILDVGIERGHAFVITEPFIGLTLTEIVAGGIIDPQQARAIVGEAAEALEIARRHGVHHLALRPDAIRVEGGRVLVTGLGVDAGISGQNQNDSELASRQDAIGLTALLYYAMTARWPGGSLDLPWIDAGIIHPLDAYHDAGGPVSLSTVRSDVPAELSALCDDAFVSGAEQAPTSPAEVVTRLQPWGEVTVVAALPAFLQQPVAATPPAGVNRQSVRSTFGNGTSTPRPGTPPPAPPVRRPPTSRVPRPYSDQVAPQGPSTLTIPGGGVGTPAVPSVTSPYVLAAPQPASMHEVLSQPTEPPAAPTPPRGRRFNPTILTIALIILVVILIVIWAVKALIGGIGPVVDDDGRGGGTQPSVSSSESTGTDASETRPVISKGEAIDPEGAAAGDAVGEHPELAVDAYDGAPDTWWRTREYKTASFGGLKNGVGYVITLQDPAAVSTIVLNTDNTGGRVEVRATTIEKPTDGPVLASAELSAETELRFDKATAGDSFVLWFSELPKAPDGKYRVDLIEILVS